MMPITIRKMYANIIAGFVYNHSKRLRTRVNVAAPLWRCVRFVRKNHGKNVKIQRFYGAGGKSLVLGVDKKCVYKFSCMRNGKKIATREKEIVDYMKNFSPIPVLNVDLFNMGGEIVRKYDFINGTDLAHVAPKTIIKNADVLGKQIANFLFVIGKQDPECLKKYKAHAIDIPRPFYGWNHEDWDNLENFIIDKKTLKIIAVIDWENAQFGDFYWRLYRTHRPEKRVLFDAVEREYWRLFNKDIGLKK